MGTGQSLLALAAMMLLTMITTRVNSTILTTQETTQNSKFALVAISLATSKIEQASRLAFDENTMNTSITSTSSLCSTMGRETGETKEEQYDDCDDYNNFYERDSSLVSALYDIRAVVSYVQASTPNTATSTKTWNKKITISVASPTMRDTIRLSTVVCYWNFR